MSPTVVTDPEVDDLVEGGVVLSPSPATDEASASARDPESSADEDPDGALWTPGPVPVRIAIAVLLTVAAAGIMVGGIFKGVTPRIDAIAAGLLGVVLATVAGRVRKPLTANVLTVLGLFAIGLLLVSTSGFSHVMEIGTRIAEARAEGDVLRPPVPFVPGWQALVGWVMAMLAFTAMWTATVFERPAAGLLLPLPVAGIAAITVPESQQVASGIAALVLFAMGLGVLASSETTGDGEAGPSVAFELRRALRSLPLIAGITVALVLLSQANFLFPAPLIDPTQEPQAPKTVPLSEVEDRVLFTANDCAVTGPWRIGSLDVYTGEDWRLPPFADNQLTEVDASGIVDGDLEPGVACRFEIFGLDGSVLPGLPNAVGIQTTGPRLAYDARNGNIRVDEGQIGPGLVYTVVAATTPSVADLEALDTQPPPSDIAAFMEIPAAPAGVRDLIAQAPTTSKWEQFDFLRTWILDNVVASGPGVPVGITPERVEEMIVGDHEASPYEIVAAQAMLARWVQVPSRIGYGFDGGEPLEAGDGLEVRPRHGASFVEVWFPGYKWLPVIGTPRQAQASVNPDNAQSDPNILPSTDIAVELYLPTVTPPPSVLTRQIRDVVVVTVLVVLLMAMLWALYPALAKAIVRSRRRSWATGAGARARIALAYAEFRDLATDLGFGHEAATPLEFVDHFVQDDEHLHLAWLVTRTLWGDLAEHVTEDHAAHAQELARSLKRRMGQAQPVSMRLVAAVSRLSMRDPFAPELDRLRIRPSRRQERAHARSAARAHA